MKGYYHIIQAIRFGSCGVLVIFFYWVCLQDAYYILQYTLWHLLFVSFIIVFGISEILYGQVYKQSRWLKRFSNLLGAFGLFAVFGQILGMMVKYELMKDIMEVVFCTTLSIIWVAIGLQWKHDSKDRIRSEGTVDI